MISKEEAKIKLRKAGYNLASDNAVITILIPETGNIKNTVKNVKELFIKIGYEASFGVKQTSSDIIEDFSEADYIEDNMDASLEDGLMGIEDKDNQKSLIDVDVTDEVLDKSDKNKAVKKVTKKSSESKNKKDDAPSDEIDFFDDEDENPESIDSKIELDALDMDMLLNEDSIQFSLEDFGMM